MNPRDGSPRCFVASGGAQPVRAFSIRGTRAFVLAVMLTVALPGADAVGISPSGFLGAHAVWFPPSVPVSGEAIADPGRPRSARERLEPPSGLADFVNESFYPALSSRLDLASLSKELETRLDTYRERRGALVNELADQLVALQGSDRETRRIQLETFAAQQTPRIVSLEREAEALRRALIDGGLLRRNVDWNGGRRWRIGVTRFAGEHGAKEAEFQVMRAAAYYQDGFTAEQRGLLRELAAELQVRARAARPVPAPRDGDPAAMFFSPATARMRLPAHLPPGLVAMIGRFNRGKTLLKQELREAVLAHDHVSARERESAFEVLADAQWLRLIELEKQAEEIRVSMATVQPAALAAAPHIPPGLLARIELYNRERGKYIQEFEEALGLAVSMVRPPLTRARMTEDERVQLARKLAEERAALRTKIARDFWEETRERFEDLRGRFEQIQADLALVAAGQFDRETGRPLTAETLLQGYSMAIERFDTFGREEVIYRGYRTAMLLPGLSPEQRRLLFGAALVGLAQPLPHGERVPTSAQPVTRSD